MGKYIDLIFLVKINFSLRAEGFFLIKHEIIWMTWLD